MPGILVSLHCTAILVEQKFS